MCHPVHITARQNFIFSEYVASSAFTGKERDEETGYGYFGARYMDHELMTMWLSVDPMADKYPNLSPYAYCAWNPVKLVDPDGREINPVYDKNGDYIGNTKEGFTGVPIIIDDRRLKQCLYAEGTEINNLSCEEVAAYGRDFDNVATQLSGEVQSRIWTNIVESYNGTEVGEFTFDISEIGGKIEYDFGEILKGNFATLKNEKVLGRRVYPERYETTVENVISTVVYHEWYGHAKKGYSGCNEKKSNNCDHYKCYEAVINSPIFKSTTEKYQEFYNETYNFYNQ